MRNWRRNWRSTLYCPFYQEDIFLTNIFHPRRYACIRPEQDAKIRITIEATGFKIDISFTCFSISFRYFLLSISQHIHQIRNTLVSIIYSIGSKAKLYTLYKMEKELPVIAFTGMGFSLGLLTCILLSCWWSSNTLQVLSIWSAEYQTGQWKR